MLQEFADLGTFLWGWWAKARFTKTWLIRAAFALFVLAGAQPAMNFVIMPHPESGYLYIGSFAVMFFVAATSPRRKDIEKN